MKFRITHIIVIFVQCFIILADRWSIYQWRELAHKQLTVLEQQDGVIKDQQAAIADLRKALASPARSAGRLASSFTNRAGNP